MDVLADWPGTVIDIAAAVGDEVEEGTAILTIELTKMETAVDSPTSRRISAIHATPEQVVENGDLLVERE